MPSLLEMTEITLYLSIEFIDIELIWLMWWFFWNDYAEKIIPVESIGIYLDDYIWYPAPFITVLANIYK